IVAARSAGRMRSAHAAVKIAFALRKEADPGVKEQQIKALGEIGSATARDTLAQISSESGRLGVIAAGSLIAVGDPSGKAKLEAAAAAPQPTLRLAAMQAASAAKNPIVVPALKIGVVDGVFEIRFTAAEGLASFNAEKAAAMPVLAAALKSREAAVVGRAIAALARFGEKIRNQVQTPAKMLHSTDARQRLAVVPVARALPPRESVPLLRRLIVDPDREVRYAAVEAIETVASKHKDQAIKLYKSLVNDEDPVVRSKAAGQLARLLPPHAKTAVVPPAVDDSLPKVQEAAADANAASSEAKAALEAFEALASELATATAASTSDDAAINHIEELAANLGGAAAKLEAVATKVEAAATAASTAAGATPSPDAAELVAEAKALAQSARDAAATARGKAADAAAKARTYVTAQTGDLRMYLAAADSAIRAGNFIGAQNSLDKATSLLRKSGAKDTSLDFLYGRLHDKMAETSRNPADKRQLLQQAADAYRRFVKTGTGRNAQTANERLAEIADELKQLGP
ncbi:MAG TPA: HEAT repeat domain-containing protein, partial [Thermoanaerobaculia bacterium]|nr:HEAT repeat domain-containing protein [Thermoanaerobaculia bacterium]